jgi:N-acetylmuramoyl-L-alanine amidase
MVGMGIGRINRKMILMGLVALTIGMSLLLGFWLAEPSISQPPLFPSRSSSPALKVVYPKTGHQTTAEQIFLIGTAPLAGQVWVNDRPIARSAAGHFAPSFPLTVGQNKFTLRYQKQTVTVQVQRQSKARAPIAGSTFAQDSLTPQTNIARAVGELLCFQAIAPAQATVSVKVADRQISLQPQNSSVSLAANSGVLTGRTQPMRPETTNPTKDPTAAITYGGCTQIETPGEYGQPLYALDAQPSLNSRQKSASKPVMQSAPGKITILAPQPTEKVAVTAEQGVARTGPSTDYSRLTPLPKGTQAIVTGLEGEWLRLDYGAWLKQSEGQVSPTTMPVRSLIRGITSRPKGSWTEVLFPLEMPVPIGVQQHGNQLVLTLHHTIAQTDTIRLSPDSAIQRLDWQQVAPETLDYRFTLTTGQPWGYKLRYEGTTLILAIKHPPQLGNSKPRSPLQGVKILLDPGHGGPQDRGSVGPTGYPEKDVALVTSKLLRQELQQRGATVVMTREHDIDLDLPLRTQQIEKTEPAIALSLHYNALPDDGDAARTKGVATFWYQGQAQDLAVFLHDYLVTHLDRPSYGVFWNNLALTRPTIAPAVLVELGFMINPTEFEWITNPQAQKKLAHTLADGVTAWMARQRYAKL